MKPITFFLLISVCLASACAPTKVDRTEMIRKQIKDDLAFASSSCLDLGFFGHEPEYRGCVITTANKIQNLRTANAIKEFKTAQ